jgi:MFS family permease
VTTGLLRNRNFLLFWTGETVSLFGYQITSLALPLTALFVLHASEQELGVLRTAAFIPFLILSLPLGALSDRRPKRPLMILANTLRALLVAAVPLLAVTEQLTVAWLVLIALALGACAVLFDVCWQSYVPLIVAPEQLVAANGRVGASSSAAEFAGPGLGGLLVQWLTAPIALVANALSYAMSVVSLAFIKAPEPARREAPARQLLDEIREGLIFVVRQPYLRVQLVSGAAYNICYMAVEVLFLLYAARVLDWSAGLIGVVISASAVGGLLGATLAAGLTTRFPFGVVYATAVVVGNCGPLLIPLADGSAAVATAATGLFLMRAGLAVANVAALSLRQTVTPRDMMARMNAGMRTVTWGLGALGATIGGLLGGVVGVRNALWLAAAGFVVAALPVLLSRIPRIRVLRAEAVASTQDP